MPDTSAAAAPRGPGNKPWAAVVPSAVRTGIGVGQREPGTEAAHTLAPRTEGPPAAAAAAEAGNTVDGEPASGQGQPQPGCNARPSSTRWDPHGTGRRPPLQGPRDECWPSSSARRWSVGAR